MRGWYDWACGGRDQKGALEGVASVSRFQPGEEGLHDNEEEEGGHRVALDGAAVDGYSLGEASCSLYLHCLTGVDVSNEVNCVFWKSQPLHGFEKAVVRDCREAVLEVNVEEIEVGARYVCVLQGGEDDVNLVRCGHVRSEPSLLGRDQFVSGGEIFE